MTTGQNALEATAIPKIVFVRTRCYHGPDGRAEWEVEAAMSDGTWRWFGSFDSRAAAAAAAAAARTA